MGFSRMSQVHRTGLCPKLLLYHTKYGPLPEELNHTIWASPGGVKSTEAGSARNYCYITQNMGSPGGVKSRNTAFSRWSQVHRTGLCPPKLLLNHTTLLPGIFMHAITTETQVIHMEA